MIWSYREAFRGTGRPEWLRRLPLIGLMTLSTAFPAFAQTVTAQSAGIPAPNTAEYKNWQLAIQHARRAGSGCMEADYPSTTWKPVSCGEPASTAQIVGRNKPLIPLDENSSGDYTLTSAHAITNATGSLPFVENSTSVYGFGGGKSGPVANEFNLQMNTETTLPGNAANSLCANAPWGPNGKAPNQNKCTGWMQFVYDSGGTINIQSWALNYTAGNFNKKTQQYVDICPSSLPLFSPPNGCGKRTVSEAIPVVPFSSLGGVSLSGAVFKDNKGAIVDQISVFVGGKAYSPNATPDVVGAYGNWKTIQFNVYGNSGGDESIFNSGTLVSVSTSLITDTGNSVTCTGPGGTTTGESTNLTENPCTATNTPAPANIHSVAFVEGVAPAIATVSPSSGPNNGGTTVTITATTGKPNNTFVVNGFNPGAIVKFNGVPAQVQSCVTTATGSTCTVTSPPYAGPLNMPVDITVANPFRNGVLGPASAIVAADKFTYYQGPAFSEKCPPGENAVPPIYTLTTPVTNDFYEWSGTPINASTPPPAGLQYLSTGTLSTGPASDEPIFVAACPQGQKTGCTSFSLDAAWCYTHVTPPPPPVLKNCLVCLQTNRQCKKVPGGYQCTGNAF
jgi:hypothetical protein